MTLRNRATRISLEPDGEEQAIPLDDLRPGTRIYVTTDMGHRAELDFLGLHRKEMEFQVALWGDDLPPDRSGETATRKRVESIAPERMSFIRSNIEEIAARHFPDNAHNRWKLWSTVHDGPLSYVEVRPTPDDVGYPAFKFLLYFEEEQRGEQIAVYAKENGEYSLLSSDPAWEGKLRDRPL